MNRFEYSKSPTDFDQHKNLPVPVRKAGTMASALDPFVLKKSKDMGRKILSVSYDIYISLEKTDLNGKTNWWTDRKKLWGSMEEGSGAKEQSRTKYNYWHICRKLSQ